MTRVYLDHAATTLLRPEAAEAMRRGFELWANPSSPHAEGRAARAALENARARVKAALGWDGEVIFTSGASEAAALALGYADAPKQYVSAIEHDAVLKSDGFNDFILPARNDGAIDAKLLKMALDEQRTLVAIQHVNSETGNRQDLARLGAIVADAGGILLADCAQSAGKFPLPEVDLAIVSAHKFGGPIGIGALLVQDFAMLQPMGGQERGYRRGTENLPGVLGMAEPLDSLAAECRELGGEWLSDRLSDPTPYIRAIAMPGLSGSAQLMRFDMAGISVSQGSACSSGSLRQSHVLEAMGLDQDLASRTIRVSFGWNTTREEVERFCETWLAMAREAAERAA